MYIHIHVLLHYMYILCFWFYHSNYTLEGSCLIPCEGPLQKTTPHMAVCILKHFWLLLEFGMALIAVFANGPVWGNLSRSRAQKSRYFPATYFTKRRIEKRTNTRVATSMSQLKWLIVKEKAQCQATLLKAFENIRHVASSWSRLACWQANPEPYKLSTALGAPCAVVRRRHEGGMLPGPSP